MNIEKSEELLLALVSQMKDLDHGLESTRMMSHPNRAMFEAILVNIKTLNVLMVRLICAASHINPAIVPSGDLK